MTSDTMLFQSTPNATRLMLLVPSSVELCPPKNDGLQLVSAKQSQQQQHPFYYGQSRWTSTRNEQRSSSSDCQRNEKYSLGLQQCLLGDRKSICLIKKFAPAILNQHLLWTFSGPDLTQTDLQKKGHSNKTCI